MFQTVAVIDHNLQRRDRLYQVLTELNYQVTAMPSHQELAEFLQRERPQCVIAAFDQPDGSDTAATTLHHLREMDKNMKIVALVPASRLETLAADSRLRPLNAEVDQLELIRTIIGILKEREVERVDEQVGFNNPILIIEDEPRIAHLFQKYLTQRGYTVTVASNGEEALVQMHLQRPRIVVLDILLPGMDGLLTLQRIKAIDPSVSVIMSSGFEDMGLVHQAATLGASTYLVKPFNLSKLEAAILTSCLQQPSKASVSGQ